MTERAGRVVAVRVIFTSGSVILSIKAKRTAAHHNSYQAGSSTAVQSSASSEDKRRSYSRLQGVKCGGKKIGKEKTGDTMEKLTE